MRFSTTEQVEDALRDGLVDVMRNAGIEVITDVGEGQRVLDAAMRAEEVLEEMRKRKSQKPRQLNSSDEEQATHATDVSEAEGTKELQNLETLAKKYENLITLKRGDYIVAYLT